MQRLMKLSASIGLNSACILSDKKIPRLKFGHLHGYAAWLELPGQNLMRCWRQARDVASASAVGSERQTCLCLSRLPDSRELAVRTVHDLGQMNMPRRTTILISGRGSNMMSLVEAAREPGFPAEIAAVISNRPDAAGIAWAAARGVATRVVDHKAFAGRAAFEAELHTVLTGLGTDLVCLAGFMRVLTAGFVQHWQGSMINIHPSLLPAFKGLHTHEQALAAGVKITGCTVHFVVPEMDAGPIIAQAAVPVHDGDTTNSLAARILVAEHKLYPLALQLVADGRVQMNDPGAAHRGEPPVNHANVLYSPPLAYIG